MTQVLPRYCPRCGAPIVTNSGACATCGLPLEGLLTRGKHKPSEQNSYSQDRLQEIDQKASQHNLDVHQDYQLDRVPTEHLGQQSNLISGTQSSTTTGDQAIPNPPTRRRRRVDRRKLLVLLVIGIFILGAVFYAFAGFLGLALPGFVITQPPITTTLSMPLFLMLVLL